MEEQNGGISLTEIFRTIFLKKWIFLIIATVITLGGTLGIYFGYNALNIGYACTFTVNFPGSDEAVPVYPDGSNFNYRDIISLDNMTKLKESDEKFDHVNVEAMYKEGAIGIARTERTLTTGQVERVYTISVSNKYFNDYGLASAFIEGLAQSPVKHIEELALSQDMYIDGSYDYSDYYEDKVNALLSQQSYLAENIELIGENAVGAFKSSCVKLLTLTELCGRKLNDVINEMRTNKYVYDSAAAAAHYGAQVKMLEGEREAKLSELKMLTGTIDGGSSDVVILSERIEELARRVAEIERETAVYRIYTGGGLSENKEFVQRLDSLKDELLDLTDGYEELLAEYYHIYSVVSYAGATDRTGEMSWVTALLISLFVGLVVAAIISYLLGKRAAKKSGAPAAEAVSAAEAEKDGAGEEEKE